MPLLTSLFEDPYSGFWSLFNVSEYHHQPFLGSKIKYTWYYENPVKEYIACVKDTKFWRKFQET